MGLKELFVDRKTVVERVELPDHAGEWFVREMSSAELTRFHERYDALKAKGKELLWFLCLAACDSAGHLVFEEADIDGMLVNVPGWIVVKVWMVGGRLNLLTKAAMEDVEKN